MCLDGLHCEGTLTKEQLPIISIEEALIWAAEVDDCVESWLSGKVTEEATHTAAASLFDDSRATADIEGFDPERDQNPPSAAAAAEAAESAWQRLRTLRYVMSGLSSSKHRRLGDDGSRHWRLGDDSYVNGRESLFEMIDSARSLDNTESRSHARAFLVLLGIPWEATLG